MIRRLFLALIVMALAPLADAQLALPKQLSEALKPAADNAAPSGKAGGNATGEATDPRAQAAALLADARRQLEEEQLKNAGADPEDLQATARQRQLDRLVMLYGERLKLLDEVQSLQDSPIETANQKALMAALAGPPPYSALRVDALRDEHDSLKEQLKSLAAAERALLDQQAGLLDTRRQASEAFRLADDRLARAKGREQVEKDRRSRDFAELRRQQAEAELSVLSLALDEGHLKQSRLQSLGAEMQRLLDRVLPEQTLSKEDFEQQQAQLRKTLAKVNAEIDRMVVDNGKRTAERARLLQLPQSPDASGARARRLQLLDEQLETDRLTLMTLTWLQGMMQVAGDSWGQRFVAFSSDDAATRQAVITTLAQTSRDLASRKDLFRELQEAARMDVRQQEARLDGAVLDAATAAQESAILEALRKRVQTYQRVEIAGSRLDRQLKRWLGDFGFDAKAGSVDNWKLGALQAVHALKSVWDFEMFAVEDSTVVDGKTVTIAHGVTVGKSVGGFLLFILGYWLFSMLSGRLQRLMVGRFGVEEQVASVIRRWAMIALAVVLVIFILNLARIPLTVFAFMGGALAIGVGFGTQTIIKNVISGIIVLFERKIRVGDIIALNGVTGYVTQVDLRASTVRGFDGVEALIPNSSFLENQVVNWTYSNTRIRREIRIGVAYGSPVHDAADIISGCADDHGQVLRDPKPEVFFEDFGDNALLLVLVFWVELGPNLMGRRVDSDLRHAMDKRLAAAGITIPFPQRDVHLDVRQPLPVRFTSPAEHGN
ncbi:mechanosensitive ion channel domain-containing protein [Candidatus Accumulibacter sp. ACC003]|uniref:mechanosensitive ion channel domain-containing protein n=1 Tax=Candidatus Accumulibacter sp. ACC003 TaxID=2823334 RepID=UPI0025BE907B|nr:mechanosensitive ion channel domain-containing protein [Candidatus Accumulibacter sp. ACC003]